MRTRQIFEFVLVLSGGEIKWELLVHFSGDLSIEQRLAIDGEALDEGDATMPVRFTQTGVAECNFNDEGVR